ncbi:hypothetical protein B0H19DRAFT_1140860, partial [Mycena capillaripes]
MLVAVAKMSLSLPAALTRGDAAIELDLATAPVLFPVHVTLYAKCLALALSFPAEGQRAGPHHPRSAIMTSHPSFHRGLRNRRRRRGRADARGRGG